MGNWLAKNWQKNPGVAAIGSRHHTQGRAVSSPPQAKTYTSLKSAGVLVRIFAAVTIYLA
jgi:hypothetical protein